MNAHTTSYRRGFAPAIFALLAAALALAALMMFCNTQRATAQDQPTVELTLVAGQGWNSTWFNSGSPVKGVFASNGDGAFVTGSGTATRSSDGYQWVLDENNPQFLNPLSDTFLFESGAISETWTISVSNEITEPVTIRNDAWFELAQNPEIGGEVGKEIPIPLHLYNSGEISGTVQSSGLLTETINIASHEVNIISVTKTYTESGIYTETLQLQWENYVQQYLIRVSVENVPVNNVDLWGNPEGKVGESLNFTACPNLDATGPITFTWIASEQEEIITTTQTAHVVLVNYTWDTPGVKNVMVIVTNEVGNIVTDTMTVTVSTPAPTIKKIYLPVIFNNYIAPTIIDKGEVNLTAGVGWTNSEGYFYGGADFLAGLFALDENFISISSQYGEAQISCNGQNLIPTDDDGNGIYDAGCNSTNPWVVEIKKDNIIERWHVTIAP